MCGPTPNFVVDLTAEKVSAERVEAASMLCLLYLSQS